MSRAGRRAVVVLAGTLACFTALGAAGAGAHPLGNFSISHLDTLTLSPDRIVDAAVIDTSEIPTAQAAPTVDADRDGTASPDELRSYGAAQCAAFVDDVAAEVDGAAVAFTVTSSTFTLLPGQAGLATSRLECRLEAPADLSVARSVHFVDRHLTDRVGWREINAVGDGTHLVDSPVPQTSVTDGLRNYPVDLLASPLDVREAELRVQPGDGSSTVSPDAATGPALRNTGMFTTVVDRVQRTFDDLVGRHQLTLGVGILAVALALVLGASHAVLPGHGKTVMAAYIAGRQGSVRDAVVVGATVTGTHTGGVLLLGAALTVSTSLAGESVLGWLGVTSGLLVAALGFGLLRSAVRHRGGGLFGHGHTHAYDLAGHDHGDHVHHGDHRHHDHDHDHDHHDHDHDDHDHDHDDHDHDDHDHDHDDHDHDHHHGRVLVPAMLGTTTDRLALSRSAVLVGIGEQAPAPAAERPPQPQHVSRRGLIGMGIAGGLVPSPSALIILLSAIALGRTWFGILLVLAYGLGMAATLTIAGVVLVTVRDRYRRRTAGRGTTRLARIGGRWGRVAPYATATLVLVVGLGLAVRSFGQI